MRKRITVLLMSLSAFAVASLFLLGGHSATAEPPPTTEPTPVPVTTAPGSPDGPNCVLTWEYPHVSTTPEAGIDAKARVICNNNVQVVGGVLNLFMCPAAPSGPEPTWTTQGCLLKATRSFEQPSPANQVQYTVQVPAPGSPAVTGTGYFIANADWYYATPLVEQSTASAANPLSA